MGKGRLEAFSDGVFAIIITIMVLELKVPHGELWADLAKLAPVFFSYVLSFLYVGIYWNNHHHLLHAARQVSAGILWSNLHLLFWLSLLPFTTGWMGENHFPALPVALYGFDLLMCACAYSLLQMRIIKVHGNDSVLARAIGVDLKGKISLAVYLLNIPLALLGYPLIAVALMLAVAILWIIPDRRIEKQLSD
ncbi:TMEM175 family protein [Undibacterium sp. Ren11W]|uniref:TMEM175 family protein n=1 Tax=Undibacterium sp. Ren11W TaxID=3413045 RepID=UPI003BF2646D